MRIFIAVLVLIFSHQSWTKADDIRDFQIEGMSIGDSLLEHETEEVIIKNSSYIYKKKNFVSFVNYFNPESIYDGYQVHYKNKDKKYIIYSLEGIKLFKNNINECEFLRQKIVDQIKDLFNDPLLKEQIGVKASGDLTGKSLVNLTRFYLNKSSDYEDIQVSCYDWAEGFRFSNGSIAVDKLTVTITTREYLEFLDIAY